ncbi:MAG TPA: hypothetical protein PLU10_12980, partial [Chitinophagaceae bacterium]|nr:hypothetical protein [Chitinophagaceae bacterium]
SDSKFVISARPVGSGCVVHYEGACLNCVSSAICSMQQQDSMLVPSVACAQNSIPITVYFTPGSTIQLITTGSGNFSSTSMSTSPAISYYQPSVADLERGYVVIQSITNDPDGNGPCVAKICSKTIQLLNGLVQPTIMSNLPICEHGHLELNAVGAKGTIEWTGPQNFHAIGDSIKLVQVMASMSGIYKATAMAYGCNEQSVEDTITILPLPNLQMNVSTTPEFCAGSANGSMTVTVSNGSGNYTICQSANSMNCMSGGNAVFSYLAPGNYAVQVTDQMCPDTSFTLNAFISPGTSPTPPQVLALQVVCEHESILFNGITAPGNTLLWINAATGYSFTGTTHSIPNAKLSDNGIYYVKSIDGNGCASSQSSMQVVVKPMPVIQQVFVNCQGATADIEIQASQLGAALEYSINGNTFQASPIFSGLSGATYTVYVRAQNGNCIAQQQVYVPNCACGQQANIVLDAPVVSCGSSLIPLQAVFTNSMQGTWTSNGSGAFNITNGTSPLSVHYNPSL